MHTKQREATFQHWRSVILRETRDLASLDFVGSRALADPDVRADPELESRFRSELAERRAEFALEDQRRDAATAVPQREPAPIVPEAPRPHLTPSTEIQAAFQRLAQNFREFSDHGEEGEARAVVQRMRDLIQEHPGVVPAAAMRPFEDQLQRMTQRVGPPATGGGEAGGSLHREHPLQPGPHPNRGP